MESVVTLEVMHSSTGVPAARSAPHSATSRTQGHQDYISRLVVHVFLFPNLCLIFRRAMKTDRI